MWNAFKNYNNMCIKPSWKWMKKHWKGYLVFNIICYTAYAIWYHLDDIRKHFENKYIQI